MTKTELDKLVESGNYMSIRTALAHAFDAGASHATNGPPWYMPTHVNKQIVVDGLMKLVEHEA